MAQVRVRRGIGILIGLFVPLCASSGYAASGLAAIDAAAQLQAKGCGKFAGNLSVEIALAEAGTWSMTIAADGYTGTYVAGGKGNRTLTLSPDANSLAAMQTGLRNQAATVCGSPVDSAVVTPKTIRAKLDKAGTSVSLLVKASLAGDGNPLKKGKYTLKGKGVLGPLPTTTTSTVTTSSTVTTTSTTDFTTSSTTTSSSSSTTTSTTSTTSTTALGSSTTFVTTSTSTTTTSPSFGGYGDCINGGPEACAQTETCLSTVFGGDTVGVCAASCSMDADCAVPSTGDARVVCDLNNTQACLLYCDGGETCPDGMACLAGLLCLFTGPCTPNCIGNCGDDGCGLTCGTCDPGSVCAGGQCQAGDTCVGRCGNFDEQAACQCDLDCLGAGDCCADICDPGACEGTDICTCTPNCTERVCGSDGCFGSCGDCPTPGDVCTEAGQCAPGNSCVGRCETFDAAATCQCDGGCYGRGDCCADLCDAGVCDASFVCTCTPDCTERACGSDGCFGSCGDCLTVGDICTIAGQCVPGSSCVGRCGTYDDNAFCQCDEQCVTFGDCCADLCDQGVCDNLAICAPPA